MHTSLLLTSYFNSQPHEEADCSYSPDTGGSRYFNSQPHEEADIVLHYALICTVISTHSLTRRLTKDSSDDCME